MKPTNPILISTYSFQGSALERNAPEAPPPVSQRLVNTMQRDGRQSLRGSALPGRSPVTSGFASVIASAANNFVAAWFSEPMIDNTREIS